MTMRLSTGLRNYLANGGSIAQALRNGKMDIFTGTQPSSADALATGTRLCTITNNGQAYTPEVASLGAVQLTGSSGTVNTITVGGVNILPAPVPFNSTLAQTMADVVAMINSGASYPEYFASTNGTIITIAAAPGAAAAPNGLAVAATVAGGLAASPTNMGASIAGSAAVNGLQFTAPANGIVSSSGVWSGTNVAAGVAGWFRQYGCYVDASALDSTAKYFRIDGAIATSGAEMNLSNTSFVAGAVTLIQNWAMTVPAQ
jgi:hypothetical protein